jgi:hypothetical protein
MIGMDTFSWNKVILLRHSNWQKIIDEILGKIEIFITVEGKKEFEYRFPDELSLLDKITIFPVLNTDKFIEYSKKYDSTDASLLEYSEIKGYRIITEDRPLLEEGVTSKKNVIQLLDFFYELYVKDNFFTKREIRDLIDLFRQWKNVKEKKSSYYKHSL